MKGRRHGPMAGVCNIGYRALPIGRRHDQMSENVPYARKSCHKRLIECKIYCWNARGEIYLNPVFIFITQMSWRAQREIFACAGGAVCSQRCQISVPGAQAAV